MFRHEATMLFPVEVTSSDPIAAAMLQEQFAGANSELKALLQYLVQSFGAKDPAMKSLLLNIATEEASHLEMVGTAIVQLMTMGAEETKNCPNLEPNHATTGQILQHAPSLLDKMINLGGVGPLAVDSAGAPFTGNFVNSTGDIVSDLASDLASELRARRVYEQLLKNTHDPGLKKTLEFLAEREATHAILFGEALERVKDEGVAKDIGKTMVSRRPPAVSDPSDLYLRAFAAELKERPLADPIEPREIEIQLADRYQALTPIH